MDPWTTLCGLLKEPPSCVLLCPRPRGAFWNSTIRPPVCPMAQLPRLAACSLATAGHQRCADCGPIRGHFGIARSVRLSVPWRSCLGYRHAGCLQLSHRRPPEMCGLRTSPRTDVDPPRFLPPSNCRRGGGISSRRLRGDIFLMNRTEVEFC